MPLNLRKGWYKASNGDLELWARGRQPPGGRVSDLVEEAVRILRLYAPDKLSGTP